MTTETTIKTVMVHGFIALNNDNQPDPMGATHEHTEHDSPDAHGWNVWLRRDYPDRSRTALEPFDSEDDYDADFVSLGAAMIYANALAGNFKCETDLY